MKKSHTRTDTFLCARKRWRKINLVKRVVKLIGILSARLKGWIDFLPKKWQFKNVCHLYTNHILNKLLKNFKVKTNFLVDTKEWGRQQRRKNDVFSTVVKLGVGGNKRISTMTLKSKAWILRATHNYSINLPLYSLCERAFSNSTHIAVQALASAVSSHRKHFYYNLFK